MKTGITILLSLLAAMLPAPQASAQILTQGYEWNVTEGQIFNAGEEYKITCTVTNPSLSTPIRFKYVVNNSTYFVATDNGIMCASEPTGFDNSWCKLKISCSPYSSGDFSGTDAMFTIFAGTADGCMGFLRNYGNGAYPYFAKWADDTHKSLILCRGGRDGTLTIPASLNHRIPGYSDDLPIISIADEAFKANTDVTDVVFEQSSPGLQIGSNIFAGCTGITSVKVNDAVPPACADDAFNAVGSTATLTVPVGSVLAYRFAPGWKKFKNVVNTNGDKEQDIVCGNYKARFNDDFSALTLTGIVNEVEELIIPASLDVEGMQMPVNAVAENAFNGNTRIKRIVIEPGTTKISLGRRCFAEIPYVSLRIDRNFDVSAANNISYNPFYYTGQSVTTTLEFGDSITEICSKAFEGTNRTRRVTSLKFGSNITKISNNAFHGFGYITELVLPPSLKFIDTRAFAYNISVKKLVIPASVSTISHDAFQYMTGLESVEFVGDMDGGKLAAEVFYGCKNIRDVVLRSATPIGMEYEGSNPFDAEVLEGAILSVPAGTLSAYESAAGWKDFDMIVDADGNFHREGLALRFTDAERSEAVVTGVADETVTELTIPETMSKPGGTFRITEVKSWVFKNCDKLTTVTCLSSVPIEASTRLFGASRADVRKLIVPVGSVRRYFKTDSWGSNFNIIVNTEGSDEREYSVPPFVTRFDEKYDHYSIYDVIASEDMTELTIPATLPYYDEEFTVDNIANVSVDLDKLVIAYHETPLGMAHNAFGKHLIKEIIVDRPVNGDTRPFDWITSDCITFTDNVTEIPVDICSWMNVRNIRLGANVTAVKSGAFAYVKNLENICLDAIVPPVCAADVFDTVDLSAVTLTVPTGTLAAYAAADVWKDFGTIVEADGTFISGIFICQPDTRKGYEGQIKIKGLVSPEDVGETLTIPGTLPYSGREHTVSLIMGDAFAGNENIKSIVIQPGDGELYLGNGCFANVPFTSLTIDRNFRWQKGQAYQSPFRFDGDAPMASLTLGDNMTEVSPYAFDYVGSRFEKVVMGDNIARIETWGMPYFEMATELILPRNLEFIGSEALKKWYKIKSLVIPASVKLIEKYAFSSCTAVETLEFEGDNEDIIIQDCAFDWLLNMKDVIVNWENPVPLQTYTFRRPISCPRATLHVPQGCVKAYSQADVWKTFSMITDGTESWPHAVTVNVPDHASVTFYERVAPLNVDIKASHGWLIHSVSHNDNEVTDLLDSDGRYVITGKDANEHNLNVVFEQDVVNGVGNVSADDSNVRVCVVDGTIYITGATDTAVAAVYDINGICLYAGTERAISLNSRGTFILKVGTRTFKVLL